MKLLYSTLLCLFVSSSLMAQICTQVLTPKDLPVTNVNFFVETLEPGQTTGPITSIMMNGACFDLASLPPVQNGGSYKVFPVKSDNAINGVSTLDLVLSSRHILKVDTLKPYAQIAADVDASLEIDIIDIYMVQQNILYLMNSFPADSWQFIDADFPFTDLSQGFPNFVLIDPAAPPSQLSFVGIKTADVNGNSTPLTGSSSSDRSLEQLIFKVEDRDVTAGEIIEVDFLAKDFTNLIGFQFTFDFEESVLEFQKYTSKALNWSDQNLGTTPALLDQGTATMFWLDLATNVNIPNNQALFSLQFKATQAGRLSDLLQASSAITNNKAYSTNSTDQMEVYFDYGLSTNLEEGIKRFEVFQNQPNPVHTYTQIPVRLAEAGPVQLTITNTAGQIIKSTHQQYPAGLQFIPLERTDFGAAGMYFYTLKSKGLKNSKKMIVK